MIEFQMPKHGREIHHEIEVKDIYLKIYNEINIKFNYKSQAL